MRNALGVAQQRPLNQWRDHKLIEMQTFFTTIAYAWLPCHYLLNRCQWIRSTCSVKWSANTTENQGGGPWKFRPAYHITPHVAASVHLPACLGSNTETPPRIGGRDRGMHSCIAIWVPSSATQQCFKTTSKLKRSMCISNHLCLVCRGTASTFIQNGKIPAAQEKGINPVNEQLRGCSSNRGNDNTFGMDNIQKLMGRRKCVKLERRWLSFSGYHINIWLFFSNLFIT